MQGPIMSQKEYETNLSLDCKFLIFWFWRARAYGLEKSQILG